jgi:hypothetical protein
MSDGSSANLLDEILHCLYMAESLSLTRLLLILKKLNLEAAKSDGKAGFIETATTEYGKALDLYRMVDSTFSDNLLRLQETKLKLERRYSTEMTEDDLIDDVGEPARHWYLESKAQVDNLLAKM